MLPVVLVWAGLAIAGLGALTAVRPLRALRVSSRARGASLLAAGVSLAALGAVLPAGTTRIPAPATHLDRIVPAYQFHERHETWVAAEPHRVYQAVKDATADEILLFQLLTAVRRLGRRGPESILNAPGREPILDVATRSGFVLLAEDAPRELVIGTLVLAPRGARRPEAPPSEWFPALQAPGFAKAVMGFRLEPEGRGTRVVTETRVFATDAPARRRFAAYWRVIYPGSALLRRTWLRAIRLRAERGGRASRLRDRPMEVAPMPVSKARRAGVELAVPKTGTASEETRRKAA